MAKAVHKERSTMDADYINLPETSPRGSVMTAAPGRNYYKRIAVAFGLLCFLQVALNVLLRITAHSSGKTNCKNQTADMKPNLDDLDAYFQQGWLHFRSSLYYISPVKKTWLNSRDDCVQRGADLVVISSKEEQEFINSFTKITWIGLSQRKGNGLWVWVDRTQLTESFWAPWEPNDFEGRIEECAEIMFHHLENSWNDAVCENENFWICEKKIV